FDYIEANLEKPLTLEDLAREAHFSKFHFNRIFKALTGETPFQFILRLRLEKAATLMLINPKDSITDIAYRCGFSDLSIFSRNFKSHFGRSATQYRLEKSNLSQANSNRLQASDKPSMYLGSDFRTIKWKT
ncbi:AraC family transcriptional regulator, partial [Arthrospira platensis SPKY1]|nr:AraC family transcriptional regulator [Arthrospira platensis SPKY1]